ncbi:hypothetical protein JNW88_14910 [Micromonospora sp. ATA32]|nr:hypothetical protein [Micromonospora sp. ATA32]
MSGVVDRPYGHPVVRPYVHNSFSTTNTAWTTPYSYTATATGGCGVDVAVTGAARAYGSTARPVCPPW